MSKNILGRIYLLLIMINLIKTLNGSLTVLLSDSAPFTFRSNGIYSGIEVIYSGIEVQLVEAIAKELNFDINYTFVNETNQQNDIR